MVTRAEVEAAKQDAAAAESQLQESKEQISQTEKKIQEQLSQLKPKKRVPFTSRKERLARIEYERNLAGTQAELAAAKEQIGQQESEIKKYQTEVINPVEKQLTDIENEQKAIEVVNRLVLRGDIGALGLEAKYGDPLVRKYARQYLERQQLLQEDFAKKIEDFEKANPTEKLLVDWANMKITGIESGNLGQSLSIDEYNKRIAEINKGMGDYNLYDTPLPAYYDPLTGKEVFKSIAPSIAESQGLIPIEVKGYNPTTGKYLIESSTGLLTQKQLAAKQFLDTLQKDQTTLPTTFEIGGSPSAVDPLAILSPTPYQAAAGYQPYADQQLRAIEYSRLGPQGFYQKYGYEVTPKGEVLYGGTASPLLITKGEGSTESALNLALMISGGKAAASALKGSRSALASLARAGGARFSDPITEATSNIVDSIIPQSPTGLSPRGLPAQVGRGALYYAVGSNPLVGSAFIASIVRSAVVDPVGTVKQVKEYVIENPYEVATIGGLSKAELRVRQRIARAKMYYEVVDKLELQYGTKSAEVAQFKKAWNRAFNELPKRTDVIKKWTSKDVEAIAGDKKLTKILDDINSKYKPEIIGTTTITPQTTLKELPRRVAGDIDVQNVPALLRSKSRNMAYEIYERLAREGYNVGLTEGSFYGNPKYFITLNGRELINIGTDTGYFLKTQLGPLRDLFEFERIGQFRVDPETGVRLAGIRGQLRVKLAKGYGEGSTARIRELKKLLKEGKLQGREKDIIDALGIVEGTEYLFEGGRYVGPRYRVSGSELIAGVREGFTSSIRGRVAQLDNLLTGRRTGPQEYGYYENIPTRQRKAYPKPPKNNYKAPSYNPSDYLIPSKAPPKLPYKGKAPYKKTPVTPINYLIPEYTPPKKATPKKPTYAPPTNYLIPTRAPPKTPYKKPPEKTTPAFEDLLIRKTKREKKEEKGKKKKKKPSYRTLPTLTQQLIGYKGRRPIARPTGFEAIRIV